MSKEKFLQLVSKDDVCSIELLKERKSRRYWTSVSNKIAFSILNKMDTLGIDFLTLKERTGINVTTLQLMVKGGYDFKLSEILKIKEVLNIYEKDF